MVPQLKGTETAAKIGRTKRAGRQIMRELTLEELELVAGGLTSTSDISPTDSDNLGGGDYYGDYGDGMGGGGGDGSTRPDSFTVQADPARHTAMVSANFGDFDGTVAFGLPTSDLQSISLDLSDGHGEWLASIDLTHGMVGQTYSLDFGNGETVSLSFDAAGSGSGVSASLTYHL
jgi:hypothetical protein